MTYQFPPELADFVKEEIERGEFQSEAELVQAAVRLLRRDREEAIQGIEAGLADIQAGRTEPIEVAFSNLRSEFGIS